MKIAVFDDYQNVARDMADWSGLEANHEITFFPEIYEGLDGFAKRLEPFEPNHLKSQTNMLLK